MPGLSWVAKEISLEQQHWSQPWLASSFWPGDRRRQGHISDETHMHADHAYVAWAVNFHSVWGVYLSFSHISINCNWYDSKAKSI